MRRTMILAAGLLVGLLGMALAAPKAEAGFWVRPGAVVVRPGPVFVRPAPAYVRPYPVYVRPAPVYVQPAPVVVPPPVVRSTVIVP